MSKKAVSSSAPTRNSFRAMNPQSKSEDSLDYDILTVMLTFEDNPSDPVAVTVMT